MIPFRTWVLRLYASVTADGASFPVSNGDYSSVTEHGVAYHLVPLRQRASPSPWFATTWHAQRETYLAQEQGQPAPVYTRVNPLVLIHWPNFLWTARFGSGSPMQPLAHELLRHLAPLIYQFDPALVTDLELFERRYTAFASKELPSPLFFGQENQAEEERFNRHLRGLIGNKEFRAHLAQTMNDTLAAHLAVKEMNALGLCTATRHFRGQSCELCKPRRWQRRYVSLLWPNELKEFQGPIRIDKPDTYDADGAAWTKELRHWLSVNHASEGIVRVVDDSMLLVNFIRVRELAKEQGRASPLLEPSFHPWPDDGWMQAFHTRLHVETKFRECIVHDRPAPLGQLVNEAGWSWNDHTLDIPYELYRVNTILHRLEVGKDARKRLALATPPKTHRKYQRRLGYLVYVDESGMSHTIHVHQRIKFGKPVNYYSVPYETYETVKERRNLAVNIGTEILWTFYAVNRHASPPMQTMRYRLPKKFREQAAMQLDSQGQTDRPMYPAAVHFSKWLATIDPTMDQEKYKQLLYDCAYNSRLLALQRGERKHVGLYTSQEEKTLRDFFSQRLAPGRLGDHEWAQLLSNLPGRSRIGVQRKLEEMGFKYALEHGYQAYRASGFCLKHSEKRRREWTKLGVRP